MKLIERLIEEGGSDSSSRNFVSLKISENVVRLIGRHFPSYVESDCSKKKKKTSRKCVPDGHGFELVSSVRALVPQKFSVEEELMHVKHVEVKSPHVGVMWKFGMGVISSGIVLVT
ncbi:hypothetical protein TNCV_2175841 [Trichonephila clavipes]|uniref:Uncharacterized protein n=1 Tax=Trichonephila clavipes TaxID=2585209 RepID=A0A8X6VEH0_TRICX|nr:hypothetical protein TNCV_2175841 [Trichonephila clavipes]